MRLQEWHAADMIDVTVRAHAVQSGWIAAEAVHVPQGLLCC